MDPLQVGEKAGTLIGSGTTGIISVLIAVIVVLSLVIVYLYRKNEAAADKRAETAARVEGALAANKAAIEDLVRSIEATDASSDDRFETVKAMQAQVLATAQLVSTAVETLREMKADMLRELLARAGVRS